MQIFHTVRPGDSVYKIASRWQIPPESVLYSNNIADPGALVPGMQLSMPPGITSYEVKPGDTLYSISQAYGIPIDLVIEANGISSPFVIHPGDILTVPEGVPYYTVRRNDTLFSIAKRYNTDTELIAKANGMEHSVIYPGMNLIIPYPPAEAFDNLAALACDDINVYLLIYNGRTGGIFSIPVTDGGPLSRVYASPDGIRYVYVNQHGVIYLTDRRTGELIALDQTYPTGPVSFTEDGGKIVYSNSSVIRIYDIYYGGFTTINRPGASYVQWLSDSMLIFEARDMSGSSLYTVNTDGTDEKRIFKYDNPMNDVRLSPDKSSVLFTSPGASISEVYILDLSDKGMIRLPSGREAKNYNPVWSNDSKRIAYGETVFEGGRFYSRITVADADGRNVRVIAIANCYATTITWSPDSDKVAYMSGCRNGGRFTEVWACDVKRPAPHNLFSTFSLGQSHQFKSRKLDKAKYYQ